MRVSPLVPLMVTALAATVALAGLSIGPSKAAPKASPAVKAPTKAGANDAPAGTQPGNLPGRAPPAPPPESTTGPWPAPVPGFVPPKPGEHPRLIFRKADLPELKRRAATPEGQAILKRLRFLLNGGDGETMPSVKRPVDAPYGDSSKELDLPEGCYTIGHAAGYGLLYQLTGDKKYADLGKQCFEWAFQGVRDRDGKGRYAWKDPTGALRCGPVLGAYALGYDLCYEGWDADFRKKVTEAFMNYNESEHCGLEQCTLGKRQHPGSNHWGAEIGGPAMALLAIKGEPGADDKKVDQLLEGSAKCFLRLMTEGWGDHGFFAEGDGCGSISSDTSFTPALQAWKVAGGRDFITPRPHAQWMTLKWVMLTLPVKAEKPPFPIRGTYEHNVWSRTGLSGSGTFAQGFGAVADGYKPALLWLYNRTFAEADAKASSPCDTVSGYPHRAVLALVNWPFGQAERDPGEVLPRAVEDKKFAFYMFRNQWKDDSDIVVTALLKHAKGNYDCKPGPIMVYGLGVKTTFPVNFSGDPTYFKATATGGVVSTAGASFGVDFSGASGAPALLVMAGSGGGAPAGRGGPGKGGDGGKAKTFSVDAGGKTFTLMALGPAPDPKADGNKVTVGGQTISLDGGNLVFAK